MLEIVLVYPLESHKFCAGIAAVQHIQKHPGKSMSELLTKLSWVVKRKLDNQKLQEDLMAWGG